MRYLEICAQHEHYGVEPADVETMTVAELIEYLADFDGDLPVVLSHDGGYTYGVIRYGCIIERCYREEDDE